MNDLENIETETLVNWSTKDAKWLLEDKNPQTVGDSIRRQNKHDRIVECIDELARRIINLENNEE